MTNLNNNSREADSNATAAEGKSPDTREEQAGSALKERKYPYIAPPEDWARVPVTGPRG